MPCDLSRMREIERAVLTAAKGAVFPRLVENYLFGNVSKMPDDDAIVLAVLMLRDLPRQFTEVLRRYHGVLAVAYARKAIGAHDAGAAADAEKALSWLLWDQRVRKLPVESVR